jgi:hypothetical protein
MIMLDLLSARSGLVSAAFFVTWATVALLVLLVSSLHVRLRRLERSAGRPGTESPYSHLVGTRIDSLAGQARLLLFVSAGCGTCRRLVEQVTSPAWTVPTALLGTDQTPVAAADGNRVAVLNDGPRISAELGIRVTPFALVVDETGRVVRAGPISSLQSLDGLDGFPRVPARSRSVRGDGVP